MATSEKSTTAPISEPYGPEVLCASWNPVAASMGKAIREVCPESLSVVDAESFLRQVYRSQLI